jgi:cob(I)alamin adenosyltransferase
MSIVTKTGDKGETGLFGGQRVRKDDVRIEAIGTVDELNALLSIPTDEIDLPLSVIEHIGRIQNLLFTAGADLATPHENNNAVVPRIESHHIEELEQWIAELERTPLPPYFVLPGGSRAASYLHTARAVCRRAERLTVSLGDRSEIGPHISMFLNRLSDFLFLAALEANRAAGVRDIRVSYS